MARTLRLPQVGAWCSTATFGRTSFEGVRRFLADLEALGYGMLWIPESFGREVLSHVALLLGASDRLIIGTGIANVWARDAVAMANGMRTLAEAYPARTVFGLGISHIPNVAQRGHRYGTPMQHMRRYLQEMDSARWDGPEPTQAAPRLLAALGPRMLEMAAELADGAHPYLVTSDHTAEARSILGTGPILAPEQSVVLSTDAATARAAGREHLAHYLDRDNYRRSFLRQGFSDDDLAAGASDRLVDAIVAWGDAPTVARRIREHLDAGADHVAVQVVADGLDGTIAGLRSLAPVVLDA